LRTAADTRAPVIETMRKHHVRPERSCRAEEVWHGADLADRPRPGERPL